MDGEPLLVDDHDHVRIARFLCLLGLGAVLVSFYAPLYGADAPVWVGRIHSGVAGLLVALIGATYVSETVRRRHVAITRGGLYAIMGWAVALAALNGFAGEYAVGVLIVYAVFGGVVVLGSTSMRPVLSFLAAGALFIGGALIWTTSPQTSPWALFGAVAVTAIAEGVAVRWALSVRGRLRTQTQTLHEQRDRLNRLVETSPHAVVRIDGNGTAIDANGRAEEILGTDVEEILSRPPDSSPGTSSGDKGDMTATESRSLSQILRATRVVRNLECSVERPDGTPRVLSVSGAPVRGADGTICESVFHLEDVTEQEHRKQALRRAEEEAEEADRLKSALLANMNHEIRTPLTAIIGFAEAIGTNASEMDLPENLPLTGYADLIEQSGKRLLETFEDMLDLSQLEAGQMELDPETVDLAEQSRRAVEECQANAQEREIDLRLEATSVQAHANKNGVQVVVQNLLDNAIKYTADGGTVWVRTRLEPEWAVLEVKDNGAGMEPATVDQLFEPFRQASTGLGREYEGAGVGLAVTREATEQMGGSITVQTEPDAGSRFLVRLPTTASGTRDCKDGPVDHTGEPVDPRGDHQRTTTH
ncbi:sensor histidine kinase [Salinibacter grassmerensis]|uniref:sensor histidine kinase n=1 Tax=Salinibacter grassmerensis TaxID=3040353 RepID=UPI0021E8CD34|nr:ATP-binding protein [Salinibacter grassmerensis]